MRRIAWRAIDLASYKLLGTHLGRDPPPWCVCVLAYSKMALVLAVTLPAADTSLTIDFDQKGPTFDGIGALSGGGGTSRLLYDYPEPQRAEILDTLFDTDGGALQIFKVEIGGDAQSTEATEASHMHTRDDENYERGYEWWLMAEAKRRNPEIKLYGLSWGAPGWVGDGQYFSDDNLAYHLNWLKGAKAVHNLTVDYMGIWNEHSYSMDWVVELRRTLDREGFSDVQCDELRSEHTPQKRLASAALCPIDSNPRCRVHACNPHELISLAIRTSLISHGPPRPQARGQRSGRLGSV